MEAEISKFTNHNKKCQRFKKKKKRYEKILRKNVGLIPLENLYIDLVDLYSVTG